MTTDGVTFGTTHLAFAVEWNINKLVELSASPIGAFRGVREKRFLHFEIKLQYKNYAVVRPEC